MERSVPRNLRSLADLVGFVREFLDGERLSRDLAFDLDLVLEELFTNVVRHGSGDGDVVVSLEHADGEVRIGLRAREASSFDPTRVPRLDLNVPIEQRPPGGLGIHFVRELSRRFRYEWRDGVGTISAVLGRSESCSNWK